MMDPNKLTEKAQEAIAAAQRDAEERHNTQLEPEHLLLALMNQEAGVVPAVIDKLGLPPARVKQALEKAVARFARSQSPQQVYLSPRFRTGSLCSSGFVCEVSESVVGCCAS